MQLHQHYQQISQYAHPGSHHTIPCIPGTAAAAIPVSSGPSCYQMYYHQTQYPYYNSTVTQSPYNHGSTPQSMGASSGALLRMQGLYSRRV
jgi:hypothetical protein